jgi:hypothetical protein
VTPEVPESAVRLEATGGAGLTFIMERHAYAMLDAASRSEVFAGGAPLADETATAEEAGRLADFLEGDSEARHVLTSADPEFFGGPAVTGLTFFLRRSGGFRVDVPEVPPVSPPSRN